MRAVRATAGCGPSSPGRTQGSLGARIRAARLVPYQAVIGAREAAADLALRLRDGRRPGAVPVERLLDGSAYAPQPVAPNSAAE